MGLSAGILEGTESHHGSPQRHEGTKWFSATRHSRKAQHSLCSFVSLCLSLSAKSTDSLQRSHKDAKEHKDGLAWADAAMAALAKRSERSIQCGDQLVDIRSGRNQRRAEANHVSIEPALSYEHTATAGLLEYSHH